MEQSRGSGLSSLRGPGPFRISPDCSGLLPDFMPFRSPPERGVIPDLSGFFRTFPGLQVLGGGLPGSLLRQRGIDRRDRGAASGAVGATPARQQPVPQQEISEDPAPRAEGSQGKLVPESTDIRRNGRAQAVHPGIGIDCMTSGGQSDSTWPHLSLDGDRRNDHGEEGSLDDTCCSLTILLTSTTLPPRRTGAGKASIDVMEVGVESAAIDSGGSANVFRDLLLHRWLQRGSGAQDASGPRGERRQLQSGGNLAGPSALAWGASSFPAQATLGFSRSFRFSGRLFQLSSLWYASKGTTRSGPSRGDSVGPGGLGVEQAAEESRPHYCGQFPQRATSVREARRPASPYPRPSLPSIIYADPGRRKLRSRNRKARRRNGLMGGWSTNRCGCPSLHFGMHIVIKDPAKFEADWRPDICAERPGNSSYSLVAGKGTGGKSRGILRRDPSHRMARHHLPQLEHGRRLHFPTFRAKGQAGEGTPAMQMVRSATLTRLTSLMEHDPHSRDQAVDAAAGGAAAPPHRRRSVPHFPSLLPITSAIGANRPGGLKQGGGNQRRARATRRIFPARFASRQPGAGSPPASPPGAGVTSLAAFRKNGANPRGLVPSGAPTCAPTWPRTGSQRAGGMYRGLPSARVLALRVGGDVLHLKAPPRPDIPLPSPAQPHTMPSPSPTPSRWPTCTYQSSIFHFPASADSKACAPRLEVPIPPRCVGSGNVATVQFPGSPV
eukprot:gene12891-biopygen2248